MMELHLYACHLYLLWPWWSRTHELLTMHLDAQFVGGSAQGGPAGGGRARQGGAAEEHVAGERLFQHRISQWRQALASINTLIREGALQWAPACTACTRARRLQRLGTQQRQSAHEEFLNKSYKASQVSSALCLICSERMIWSVSINTIQNKRLLVQETTKCKLLWTLSSWWMAGGLSRVMSFFRSSSTVDLPSGWGECRSLREGRVWDNPLSTPSPWGLLGTKKQHFSDSFMS